MAARMETGVMCIMEKSEFQRSSPNGWRDVGGKRSNVDDEFTVLVNDDDFQGTDTTFVLNSREDLAAAQDTIMRRPLFTTAKCQKPYDDTTDPESNVSYLRHEYIVLVNTGNAEINGMLNRAFSIAEQLLDEGKNFRITISFSESVKVYYNANVHASGEDNRLTQVWGCDIFLTHGVGAPNWADTNFTCQTTPQIACWIVCFPLCLFTGVPYLCYKKCLKGVKEEKVVQVMPLTVHKGPFKVGYNLLSLLFSPSTNQ
ncbi:uncharacterized protein LOC135685518 isoform X2 [Rhopilema esculentum]